MKKVISASSLTPTFQICAPAVCRRGFIIRPSLCYPRWPIWLLWGWVCRPWIFNWPSILLFSYLSTYCYCCFISVFKSC